MPVLELEAGDHVAAIEGSAVTSAPALIMIRIGHRMFPLKSEPQCRTCQETQHRLHIETALIEGYGYGEIARSLGPYVTLTARHIRRHVRNGHSALELIDMRARMELHAYQAGIDVTTSKSIVTTAAIIDEVVHQGFRKMTAGELEIKTSDLLKATAMKQEIEKLTGQLLDVNFAADAMHRLSELARELAHSDEEFEQWKDYIQDDPQIQAMRRHREAMQAEQAALSQGIYVEEEDEDTEE
jgi:predicted transcriptional regulator